MLEHGGNLHQAIAHFGRAREEWLDLSTGINPRSYPVPLLSDSAWHRLPEPSASLLDSAQAYYGASQLLPVAGTQAAIQTLPRMRAACRVIVSAPSYAEHAYQWQRHGHQVELCDYETLTNRLHACDVMVVVNPNNPTGAVLEPDVLLGWAKQLAERGGWLIVDEAFGDTMPERSVAAHSHESGLIVLRSLGKFFGLAGARVGFVCAHEDLLQVLASELGPWSLSGPAQEIAATALADGDWQQQNRRYLQQQGQRLRRLLRGSGMHSSGTDLFQWCRLDVGTQAEQCWHHMAEHGIWTRLFRQAACGVRFGLPGDEAGFARLHGALQSWKKEMA